MKTYLNRMHFKYAFLLLGALSMIAFTACESDDEPELEDPVASFQYEISEDDFLTVHFENFSQNAETYQWTFGDGETSTEENPTHTYEEPDEYEVTLTATNSAGESASFTDVVEVSDPDEALAMLAGTEHKTWKLYREGTSLGVGPDQEGARDWWALYNDGASPCRYYHEFTFHRDGDFVFDDNGQFFGEGAIFEGTELADDCFEAVPENMYTADGEDVSAYLGGTHAFEFDPSTNMVTLNGLGAWMGLPHLTSTEEAPLPVETKQFQVVSIEEHDGYDLMVIAYDYEDLYWDFTYAHYHDPSLEPEVVEEEEEEEDLETYAPGEFFNTFASTGEEDVQYLFPTEDESEVTITPGVDDPADSDGVKVGEYHRGTNPYADLKFMMDFNILFDNFSTVSIDVYLPSDNDYSGGLNQSVQIWIADMHTTQNFWESWVQYVEPGDELPLDEWVTLTFDLDDPSEGSEGTPLDRTDLDTVGLTIGGSDHEQDAVFYIRDFIFE